MDLRTVEAPASVDEQLAVDAVLGPAESGWFGGERTRLDGHVAIGGLAKARRRRHLLLPALHALQERVGWISLPALGYLCERLDLGPAEAFGVASAYALFSFEPGPPVVVHVCDDVACRAAVGGDPTDALAADDGSNGSARTVAWRRSPCLGHCEHGSAALVQTAGPGGGRASIAPFGARDLDQLVALGDAVDVVGLPAPLALVPQAGAEGTRLLRRVGRLDPSSLDAYRAAGGYEPLRRALALGPAGVIAELKESKLLGRGGAAFPTGAKWEAVARNPVRPHYFVANADESEPGTFKDRVLLDHDPYALVEALTVAGLTTGAEMGFVYLRGEYPLAAVRLEHAAAEARARGLLGDDVMGSGLRFDLEVRRGAGAYIAGEETARSTRSRAGARSPATSPPSPSTAACSTSRPG